MYICIFITEAEYLRGAEKDNTECAPLFEKYQKCLNVRPHSPSLYLNTLCALSKLTCRLQVALKARGIDKLVMEAQEDNKENDGRLMSPKSECPLFSYSTVSLMLQRTDD